MFRKYFKVYWTVLFLFLCFVFDSTTANETVALPSRQSRTQLLSRQLSREEQRHFKRTCKISACPTYAGCLRHRNSDRRDEQKFLYVHLYLESNKTQPFWVQYLSERALGTLGNVASRKYFRFHVIALYFYPEEVLDRLSIFMEYYLSRKSKGWSSA